MIFVGKRLADGIPLLAGGHTPPGEVSIAAAKPTGSLPWAEALSRFNEMVEHFMKRTDLSRSKRGATARMKHPWMGPLNAHGWVVFAGIHQSIHRRQIARIIAGL
jgi:hypothetical protein